MRIQQKTPPDYMGIIQASDYVGVGYRTFLRLVEVCPIPYIQTGTRKKLFNRVQIDEALKIYAAKKAETDSNGGKNDN